MVVSIRSVLTLALLLTATTALWMFAGEVDTVPANSTKNNSPSTKHAGPSKRAASTKRTALHGNTRRVVVRKKVNGRWVTTTRVIRTGPPAPTYQFHPDPSRYQEIQKALADRGYFKGAVNGVWGDDSVDALRRFQTDNKLTPDGHITALSLTGLGLGPKHESGKIAGSVSPATPAVSATAHADSPATPPANPAPLPSSPPN